MTLGQELRDAMRKRRPDIACLSGVCYLRLDGGNLAKAEFVSRSGNYDGLRLTVLNRRTGPVDTLTVHLGDLPRSAKSTASDDAENAPWDIYRPLPNIDALTEVVEEYLNLFRDPDLEMSKSNIQREQESETASEVDRRRGKGHKKLRR